MNWFRVCRVVKFAWAPNIFFLSKFESVRDLMIRHGLSPVYELHEYELFQFVIDCLRNGPSAQLLNDILQQIPDRGYNFRHSTKRATVPTSSTKKFDRCLSKRIPSLFNLLLSWAALPDITLISTIDDEERATLCHDFHKSYILGNEQLIRIIYGLEAF